jgi:hypothetical protein
VREEKWGANNVEWGLGLDVDLPAEKLERLRDLAENALQAAGYIVLTLGAVWLLFRFVP